MSGGRNTHIPVESAVVPAVRSALRSSPAVGSSGCLLNVTALDRAAINVSLYHNFDRDGVSQANIVRRGRAVDTHPGLVACPTASMTER
jgi:hypothetical protein